MPNNSCNNQSVNQEWVNQFISELHHQAAPITPLQLLQTSMNLFMQAERNLHLEQQPQDKGNGSYHRKLGTPMGLRDRHIFIYVCCKRSDVNYEIT